MDTAALLHVIGWDDPRTQVKIAEDLFACRMDGTTVEQLYLKLCQQDGIDDSDPHLFPSCFLAIGDAKAVLDHGPDGVFARLCNLLAFVSKNSVPMCRYIASQDGFKTSRYTNLLLDYTSQSELLSPDFFSLTTETLEFVRSVWPLDTRARLNRKAYSRYVIASEYFFHAQQAQYLEQTCVSLGICFEALMSPSSSTELSHQCAFNGSSLLGGDRATREENYDLFRQFYGLRSRIVHGTTVGSSLYDVVPDTFRLLATCLARVVGNADLMNQICNEKERHRLFRSWLFSGVNGRDNSIHESR